MGLTPAIDCDLRVWIWDRWLGVSAGLQSRSRNPYSPTPAVVVHCQIYQPTDSPHLFWGFFTNYQSTQSFDVSGLFPVLNRMHIHYRTLTIFSQTDHHWSNLWSMMIHCFIQSLSGNRVRIIYINQFSMLYTEYTFLSYILSIKKHSNSQILNAETKSYKRTQY